jgi:hypothetical protein
MITIHKSGAGGEKLQVDSFYNGRAYSVSFGEAGSPMRNLFFQGDDATVLRDEFDTLDELNPEILTRDLWLRVLDPYM